MTEDLRTQFLAGMARAAATVNVVTTDGPAGRAGVTVSAMASVSADGPAPTMLVCVNHASSATPALLENGVFTANLLREDQAYIADVFARRRPAPGGDKFACCPTAPGATGAPRIEGALVSFDCRILSAERVGTHHVVIGEVAGVTLAPSGRPLVYAARAYGGAVRLIDPPRGAARHPLRLGTLSGFGAAALPELLARAEAATGAPLPLDLHEGDQRQLIELMREGTIDLAILVDRDLPAEFQRRPLARLTPQVLLASDDPLATDDAIPLDHLRAGALVALDTPAVGDWAMALLGEDAPVAYRARSLTMLRAMVARGLGRALIPARSDPARSALARSTPARSTPARPDPARPDPAEEGGLTLRPLAESAEPLTLALASRRGAPPPEEAHAFLAALPET